MRRCPIGVLSVLLLLIPTALATAAGHVVTVQDFEFVPATLQITKGETVKWEWEAGSHTITDGDPDNLQEAGTKFDAPINAQAGTFEFLFNETGTIEYFSRANPSVKGTITVVEGTPVDRVTWTWLKTVFENPSAPSNRR